MAKCNCKICAVSKTQLQILCCVQNAIAKFLLCPKRHGKIFAVSKMETTKLMPKQQEIFKTKKINLKHFLVLIY